MIQPPQDDQDLVNFLRKHRPEIPAAAPELKDKILQQISQEKRENVVSQKRSNHRLLYLFPSAIAAGLVLFIASYRLIPKQCSDAELSNLEAFMENNWHGTVSGHPEEDISPMTN